MSKHGLGHKLYQKAVEGAKDVTVGIFKSVPEIIPRCDGVQPEKETPSASSKDPYKSRAPLRKSPIDLQQKISRKFQLEQAMVGVAGGDTGLIRLLDSMLYCARRKDGPVFQFYARAYMQKLQKLGPPLEEYNALLREGRAYMEESAAEEDRRVNILVRPLEDCPLYEVLLQIGGKLPREWLSDSGTVDEDRLTQWEEDARSALAPFAGQGEQGEQNKES